MGVVEGDTGKGKQCQYYEHSHGEVDVNPA